MTWIIEEIDGRDAVRQHVQDSHRHDPPVYQVLAVIGSQVRLSHQRALANRWMFSSAFTRAGGNNPLYHHIKWKHDLHTTKKKKKKRWRKNIKKGGQRQGLVE